MNTTFMTRTLAALLVALLMSLGGSMQALAHKVVAGAYAAGDHIEGEIGFSDGTVAKNQPVDVLAEDGTKIGETKTGEDGTFTFKPTRPIVHIFHADMGGGHIAHIRIEVADLPASLASTAGGAPSPTGAPTPDASGAAASPTALADAQRDVLLQAVTNEMKPLRKEIIALKEKDDLQSILGGLGYIAGLFGLWFYMSARRLRSAQLSPSTQPSLSAQASPKAA